jgi:hypothetical protein
LHRQRNIKFSLRRRRHDHYEQKKSLQHSRNGFHGNTLPEVNCNRYLPRKFVPKIRHVILIDIPAKGTKYAINIKM